MRAARPEAGPEADAERTGDMERREWAIHLAILLIGAVFVVESMRLGIGRIQRPGPGMLPLIASSGLGLAALFSLVRSLRAPCGPMAAEGFFGQNIGSVALILAGLVAYVLLLPWLGYLTGTLILMAFLFRAGGFRHWGGVLFSALLTTVVTYFIFSTWLSLRFPRGILGF
jgi:putative tricarboxylic transport membrane protein